MPIKRSKSPVLLPTTPVVVEVTADGIGEASTPLRGIFNGLDSVLAMAAKKCCQVNRSATVTVPAAAAAGAGRDPVSVKMRVADADTGADVAALPLVDRLVNGSKTAAGTNTPTAAA